MLEQPVPAGLSPMGGTHAGAGTECEASSPEEEGAAEATCDELMATLIPCLPVPLRGRRSRKSGVKLSPGRGEGWGESVLRFGFLSYYPTLI